MKSVWVWEALYLQKTFCRYLIAILILGDYQSTGRDVMREGDCGIKFLAAFIRNYVTASTDLGLEGSSRLLVFYMLQYIDQSVLENTH